MERSKILYKEVRRAGFHGGLLFEYLAHEKLGCMIILYVGRGFKESSLEELWTKCLLIMIALLYSTFTVTKRGIVRASDSA